MNVQNFWQINKALRIEQSTVYTRPIWDSGYWSLCVAPRSCGALLYFIKFSTLPPPPLLDHTTSLDLQLFRTLEFLFKFTSHRPPSIYLPNIGLIVSYVSFAPTHAIHWCPRRWEIEGSSRKFVSYETEFSSTLHVTTGIFGIVTDVLFKEIGDFMFQQECMREPEYF